MIDYLHLPFTIYILSFTHPAAVLTTCFGSTPNVGFSAGLDKRIRRWDFDTGLVQVLGKHDDAVQSIVWCPQYSTFSSQLAKALLGLVLIKLD